MHRAALLWVLFVAACSSAPRSTPPQLHPSDVLEVASLPPGYASGEGVSESCSGVRGFRPIHEETLGDVDCSIDRLSLALRARAAELSSRVLVGKRCQQRGRDRFSIHCSATVAEATSKQSLSSQPPLASDKPAPSAPRVRDLDEPAPRQSAKIVVSFAPQTERGARLRPRGYDRVAETAQASVGRVVVGQVSAHCLDCDAMSLRHALRVTAGRMGAGEVAAVRCFTEAAGPRCVGTALEPWSF